MPENWKSNPPSTFFKSDGTPYDPDEIASNFGLDDEYNMYFEAYDDWKKDFAEDEFKIDKAESVALLGDGHGDGLLKTNYDARTTRLEGKQDESSSSLAQGIGATMSNLTNKYADAVSQSVGQQTSFTSGASGRQKAKAFSMTQEAMGTASAEQNLKFTTTSRDLAQAGTELDAQYTYDVGAAERDLDTAGFQRDYKIQAGKKEWDNSIYNSLKQLGNKGAWDEEDEENKPSWDTKVVRWVAGLFGG